MTTNSPPTNALYIAVVTEPSSNRRTGVLWPNRSHPEIYSDDLDYVMAAISECYEHHTHALLCVDLDTGDVTKMDWQRELDGWRDEHMTVAQERALMPRR